MAFVRQRIDHGAGARGGSHLIGIVVPAHQEADAIAACLAALHRAAAHPALDGERVQVIVVLDACSDATGDIANRMGATTVAIDARNVGVCRALGANLVIEAGARWLAFTDADTLVGPDWLVAQLALNADAVCGTVAVDDWGGYGERMRRHYGHTYIDADGHRHIHGANLGVSAQAYIDAGGFLPLQTSEDVALVSALRKVGATIAWSAAPRVVTSARPDFRAPGGFGATLQRIEREEAWEGGVGAVRPLLVRLRSALSDGAASEPCAVTMRRLVSLGLDRIPLPGAGQTALRWRVLAAVAAHDLSLAKLYEGHTDALAILSELGVTASPGVWGVWAAEAPDARTMVTPIAGDRVLLHGGKAWCSGAATGDHALLTAWTDNPAQGPQLVSLPLAQAGVRVSAADWQAVGMLGSASLSVSFERAEAMRVGAPGAYLSRPGFWHGGAGVAACWWGGAMALADTLRRALRDAPLAKRGPFRLAALGKIDVAQRSVAALLREAADWIDRHPRDDAAAVALRVRLAAEALATLVLDEAGRALGAGPFCRDARFARMAADLPVFVRQSHAERDHAALAERLLDTPSETDWTL